MPTRYDLVQMLAEIREDAGEPARAAHLTQDDIKAMIRKRQAAAGLAPTEVADGTQ